MSRKLVLLTAMIIVLVSTLGVAFNVQRVEASGTIYIMADGSIDPPDAPISTVDNVTYTLTGNVTSDADGIVVERDNIVIDGAGNTLQGSGVYYYDYTGISLLERSNVTIENSRITMFEIGIRLTSSSNITISGNNMTNNEYDAIILSESSNSTIAGNNLIDSYRGITLDSSSNNTISENNIVQYRIWWGMMCGISLWGSSGNSICENNIANHCGDGIRLSGSSRNSIIANNITNNGGGIWLENSIDNMLRNNSMAHNRRNFFLFGGWHDDFVNDVDTSNTVDGKPVYYWINRRDMAVPLDAGYVALVNCANITAKNLNLTNNGQSLLLVDTTNSTITKNNMMNNWYGIDLFWSDYNSVVENNLTDSGHGIFLHDSSRNSISRNNMTNNEDVGIWLHESSNNLVQENIVTNNVYLRYSRGICVGGSSNSVSGNIVNGSKYNVDVSGDLPSHSIDSSNLVDGKPVYYLVNIKNKVINPSTHPQVGYLALINCINITVEGLTLTNNQQGLLISNTNNSKIVGNNIVDNCYGVLFKYSSNTLISGNNITNNEGGGGIDLYGSSNNSITGNSMAKNRNGICLGKSSNNHICGNNITANNEHAINLYESSNNTIYGNNIRANNGYGIHLSGSSNNSISGNNIIANKYSGIRLHESSGNIIYHNNFVDNSEQVDSDGSKNVWDDGIEGNYWSNYTGTDFDYDGIGDTTHVIDANNIDHYPLMGMFHSFNTSLGRHVNVISNSTIEDFQYFELNSTIKLYVSNMTTDQAYGFCRVCIHHALMNESNISVVIDDGATTALYPDYNVYDNGTHRWIYFAYEHSIRKIDIIPEFPSLIILQLFMITTLLAVTLYKRKQSF